MKRLCNKKAISANISCVYGGSWFFLSVCFLWDGTMFFVVGIGIDGLRGRRQGL